MIPFEIYYWKPPDWNEEHPCVIVSDPSRADRKDPVEVVMCSTQRATRKPYPNEILLDTEDGLDWPTICKCDLIYAVQRNQLIRKKGVVTHERQSHLVRTLIGAHGWPSVL